MLPSVLAKAGVRMGQAAVAKGFKSTELKCKSYYGHGHFSGGLLRPR
jgi:hypothetical protein